MPRHDYKPFIGMEYDPPFGCFQLVRAVLAGCFGVAPDVSTNDVIDTPEGRLQALHAGLAEHCRPVNDPQEGDIVLVRSRPAHIGIVIDPPYFLHAYAGGTSCIESYRELRWRNRIMGFYRYRDDHGKSEQTSISG